MNNLISTTGLRLQHLIDPESTSVINRLPLPSELCRHISTLCVLSRTSDLLRELKDLVEWQMTEEGEQSQLMQWSRNKVTVFCRRASCVCGSCLTIVSAEEHPTLGLQTFSATDLVEVWKDGCSRVHSHHRVVSSP